MKNFYNAFKYKFWFFNLFGIMPFRFTPTGCRDDWKLSVWTILLLFSVPVGCYIGGNYHHVHGYSFSNYLLYVGYHLYLLTIIMILSRALLQRKKMMEFLVNLARFDRSLVVDKNAKCLIEKRTRRLKYSIPIGILALSIVDIVEFINYLDLNQWISVVYRISVFLANTITLLFSFQYAMLVCLIGIRFRAIHVILCRVLKNKIRTNTKRDNSDLDILDTTGALYHQLWTLAQLIDSIFSPIILIHVLERTIWTIAFLYTIIKYLAGYEHESFVARIVYFIASLLEVLSTVFYSCSYTTRQARNLLKIIPELRATSEKSLLQAANFFMLLLHEGVTFTGGGFFTIDNRLLSSIVATVCSYLMIVLQFEATK